jgi:transposase-like protein
VLAGNGGNTKRTARDVGVPESTLREWRDEGTSEAVVERCARKRGELAAQCEELACHFAEVTPEKLLEAPLGRVCTGLVFS